MRDRLVAILRYVVAIALIFYAIGMLVAAVVAEGARDGERLTMFGLAFAVFIVACVILALPYWWAGRKLPPPV